MGGGKDSDVALEWRWGPRAAVEIGEAAVAQFVAAFMAEQASCDGGGGDAGGSGAGSGSGGGGVMRKVQGAE
jgi:melanoma-associated antigen